MKAYIGFKKKGDKYQYGLTIFSDKGKVLDSSTKHEEVFPNKFDNVLSGLRWATHKIKILGQNKNIDEDEKIILFISSKTIYTWFEKDVAPEPYTIEFSDLQLDLSFVVNPMELIYSKTADKNVLYKNTSEDKPTKVTDLFASQV